MVVLCAPAFLWLSAYPNGVAGIPILFELDLQHPVMPHLIQKDLIHKGLDTRLVHF